MLFLLANIFKKDFSEDVIVKEAMESLHACPSQTHISLPLTSWDIHRFVTVTQTGYCTATDFLYCSENRQRLLRRTLSGGMLSYVPIVSVLSESSLINQFSLIAKLV